MVPLNVIVEGGSVLVRVLPRESNLFIETNGLFEKFTQYRDRDRGNGAIFTYGGFSVAIIWVQNPFFLFDSHSRNVYGFHYHSEHAILSKFISISYLNN